MMLPYLTDGPSSKECTDAGLTCSIDPATGKCTECGEFEQEPQVYSEPADDWVGHHPFDGDTDQIVDLQQGGVIAYCHKDSSHRIVMALRAFRP
jgi:hypothetical protein